MNVNLVVLTGRLTNGALLVFAVFIGKRRKQELNCIKSEFGKIKSEFNNLKK